MKHEQNDLRGVWDTRHAINVVQNDGHINDFAVEVAAHISKGDKVLEIGCGIGNDALLFHKKSADVIATDLSPTLIKYNREHLTTNGMRFKVVDVSKALPFTAAQFNLIYAFASLHYFTDAITRSIFSEIHRVLV